VISYWANVNYIIEGWYIHIMTLLKFVYEAEIAELRRVSGKCTMFKY